MIRSLSTALVALAVAFTPAVAQAPASTTATQPTATSTAAGQVYTFTTTGPALAVAPASVTLKRGSSVITVQAKVTTVTKSANGTITATVVLPAPPVTPNVYAVPTITQFHTDFPLTGVSVTIQ